ncbi:MULTISPECIES: 16S rRNA (guanine(966)-N(2))-methyltransferase RsmD [Acidithiobacillus]|uniref:16S rRNA (guanine(966)-N(2))-methyltransferase RsmD n=1 Tax=Acidithiobacillus TaxID=119977 RepID=UPI000A5FCC61|nr:MULTISPECIES: 16S rRNA (guanine(966)-N(2))-methyltransferase RsmD [Acidithiobacillus]WMT46551.1 MAG: 16S rRNA (guanine(966)-N(2))-methyltransferase RsmD [Acidithiobacillus caldus]
MGHYPPSAQLRQSGKLSCGSARPILSLRIVGGRHRGRVLRTPPGTSVRPTPGIVRERLFNWLGAAVQGARVLDLFAGTGALALEAWSRGAAQVCLVEKLPRHRDLLRANLAACACPESALCGHDALVFLKQCRQGFDIVLLDPPFHQDWPRRVQASLFASPALAQARWLYLESAVDEVWPEDSLPQDWSLHRHGHCGDSHYHLYHRHEVSP